jgi:hypothetical protein
MTLSNERGSALIITLMLLLILTAIGIYAISISTTEMSIALQSKTGTATMNAAEAGVAFGIDNIPNTIPSPGYIGNLPGYIGTLTGSGAYQVTVRATPIFTPQPGYGANFMFQDFNVDGTGTAQPGFVGTKGIAAVVSYGPQPIGTMY